MAVGSGPSYAGSAYQTHLPFAESLPDASASYAQSAPAAEMAVALPQRSKSF
ncbi:hypothetical protein ACNKHT_01430 [Shigella flexneri]